MPSPPLSIVQSLSPRIAVLTSDDVVQSCEANGCRGLEELLRPWEGGTERVSVLSSTLTPTIHPSFPLRFVSYDSVFVNSVSPNPEMVIDLIGGFVGAKKPSDELHYPVTRSLLLSSRPLASHETFNHAVGVLLAVSTSTPDPLGALTKLYGQTLNGSSPWMDGVNVLRFYVVVHDVSMMGEDLKVAHELLAHVKKAYGPHSTLLVINSQVEQSGPPASPDVSTHATIPLPKPMDDSNTSALSQVYASALSSLTLSPLSAASIEAIAGSSSSPSKPVRRKLYAAKLNAEDTQRLAALVRELVVQSLVPWMEARVREWNEVYLSNRRGITGRLFGAGRKFFGASRPASPAASTGYNAVKGYYPVAAIETLTRRLADVAFMLRDYRFAASVYDSLRRDYAQDRAWRYAAAATEMYGLSQLLSHSYFHPASPPTPPSAPFTTLQHTDISSWLEQAVLAYQSRAPANQIQLDAMRITILYYEAWKAIGEYRGVGLALVRASGEADEVPSAVLIEEAAAADVKGGKQTRGRRRRAFHLVLAARRYETAGLKPYSRRCLDRASQIYRDAPWTAAQDRIEYSLGRQAYTLGESHVAVQHFLRLLRKESPGSQGGVLEDMALAYEQLASHPDTLASVQLELPSPVFDVKQTQIIASSSQASTSGTSEQWSELENVYLDNWDIKGKKPMRLIPERRVTASVGETFHVDLVAVNPLNASLVLSNLTAISDSESDVTIDTVPEVVLEPHETRHIRLAITVNRPMTVNIVSAKFLFHRFFPCTQSLQRKGKRLHVTKAQRLTPTYAIDTSLTIIVEASRPSIAVEMEWPDEMFEGEEVETVMTVTNSGVIAIENLKLLTDEYGMIEVKVNDTLHNNSIPNCILSNRPINLHPHALSPGESTTIPLTLRAIRIGNVELLGLVVFSAIDGDYTSFKISHQVDILPLVGVSASSRPAKKDSERYLLGVEITNASSSRVQINDVDAISPYWTLETGKLKYVVESDTTDFSPSAVPPNQIYRIVLNVKRSDRNDMDLSQSKVVVNLGKLLRGETVDSAQSSKEISLPLISPSYLDSRRLHRLSYLRTAFPTIPVGLLPLIFPLFDPLDLDLMISWSIPSLGRQGKSYLHSTRVAPQFSVVESLRREVDALLLSTGGAQKRTMYEETGRLRRLLVESVLEGVLAVEEDPVVIRVGCNNGGTVQWNFDKGPCSLPVIFELQNRSPLLPVRWILRLQSAPSQQETPSLPIPHYIGQHCFCGTIAANSVDKIASLIWVNEPSVVCLGGWTLQVETGEPSSQEWTPRMSWTRAGHGGVVQVVEAAEVPHLAEWQTK